MRRNSAGTLNGAKAEHDRRRHDADGAANNLGDIFCRRSLKFAEQQPAPEQPDQRVGVPEGESCGQSHVANREDS